MGIILIIITDLFIFKSCEKAENFDENPLSQSPIVTHNIVADEIMEEQYFISGVEKRQSKMEMFCNDESETNFCPYASFRVIPLYQEKVDCGLNCNIPPAVPVRNTSPSQLKQIRLYPASEISPVVSASGLKGFTDEWQNITFEFNFQDFNYIYKFDKRLENCINNCNKFRNYQSFYPQIIDYVKGFVN